MTGRQGMKKKAFTPEPIVTMLREAEVLPGEHLQAIHPEVFYLLDKQFPK
jgi:hypothetical protein